MRKLLKIPLTSVGIASAVKLSQQGQFNMSETEAKWRKFTATQLVITQRPGFDWDARIQMAPGVNAFVHQGKRILQHFPAM